MSHHNKAMRHRRQGNGVKGTGEKKRDSFQWSDRLMFNFSTSLVNLKDSGWYFQWVENK